MLLEVSSPTLRVLFWDRAREHIGPITEEQDSVVDRRRGTKNDEELTSQHISQLAAFNADGVFGAMYCKRMGPNEILSSWHQR